jgi:hypothetical protein
MNTVRVEQQEFIRDDLDLITVRGARSAAGDEQPTVHR